MILFYLGPFLFYGLDGLVVAALISALGNEELDFVSIIAMGVAVTICSIFLDLMLANEWGEPGIYSACFVTALALGSALKLIWDVELKRVALIGLFFCAFHIGLVRILWLSD